MAAIYMISTGTKFAELIRCLRYVKYNTNKLFRCLWYMKYSIH